MNYLKDSNLEQLIKEEVIHAKRNKIPPFLYETYVYNKIDFITTFRMRMSDRQIKLFTEGFLKGMRGGNNEKVC